MIHVFVFGVVRDPQYVRSHPINMRASDVSYEGESRVLQVSGTGNMFYTVRIS